MKWTQAVICLEITTLLFQAGWMQSQVLLFGHLLELFWHALLWLVAALQVVALWSNFATRWKSLSLK